MSNPIINTLFLNLLTAAIWDKPADAHLFKGLDSKTWNAIVDMARRQTVSALIADKALSLPKESLPPRELILQFMIMIDQTKALNHKMIHVLSELTQEYKEANFPFCLLKGLGNGLNYPSPLLRNAGDLDLYIYRKGDWQKSMELMTSQGFEIKDGHQLHYSFNKEDIMIEIHRHITYFDHKKYDLLFKKWEEELIEKENFTSIQIDNLTIQQLPTEMNALFIFQHMFHHFVHAGVGFRQFCDWILFLSKYNNEIDTVSFTALANRYAILYPMQVFASAAVKYLGAPENIFPFEMIQNDAHADLVIADILESGNFGYHKPGKKRPKEKIPGLWFSYKTIIRRSIKFGAISPEHIRVLPFLIVKNTFKPGFIK